ncbi:conjugal transfer protein TraD [Neorhizobium sp. T786]|uniref:conjugal transfer protein TraD n=1 Tax=Pseudorhizobium xiangyangii TaxID=2883104 RepID=UPI001CFFBD58|nr:conjugal transfer protein TraD [Neorhizobium xiangyangii]MCB5205582.1 conjugal transfer protein TraD [Neorhizobium xiangyangii]
MRDKSAIATDDRKRDARQKIMLGGLVIKAGLGKADRAFILGLLIEGSDHQPGTPEYERLVKLGKERFQT